MRLRDEVPRQTATLSIRLYDHELSHIKKAAKLLRLSLAKFVRDSLVQRAGRVTGAK